MVALDRAFVLIGRNGRANRKTRWNTDAARQSNKIGVEIRAVAAFRRAKSWYLSRAVVERRAFGKNWEMFFSRRTDF